MIPAFHNIVRKVVWLLLVSPAHLLAANLSIQFVDEQGSPVKDVAVALIPDIKPDTSDRPKAIVDQRNYAFTPHVLAVRTNTLVYFPNSDNIRHQVYSFSPAKRFELRLYHGQTADPVLFDKPGMVVLGCNIHDSMVGYIYIFDSDFFAVADDSGRANINNIPAGRYSLSILHYRLLQPYPEQKMSLVADQDIHQKILLRGFAEEKTDPHSLDNLFK